MRRIVPIGIGSVVALGLASCGAEPASKAPESGAPASSLVVLDAPQLARRVSLDLRGVLPTVEELDQVEADPEALDDLIDAWLEDPRFEERIVELYGERWRTELDEFLAFHWEFGLSDEQRYRFVRSVGQEPLRVVGRVAAHDLPYTTILTAEWTMADPMLADIYPLERLDSDAEGWTEAQYTDGRPAAGVLATNGLWWRYESPLFNYSRRRTAAILDLLVCDDLLERPVVFDSPDLADSDDAQNAVLTNDDCLTCHATIEPIAAALFGFEPVDNYSVSELIKYHPAREAVGPEALGVDPAWAGQPVDGLAGLSRAIAADTRFIDCAVDTLASGMLHRPLGESDRARMRDVRDRFVEGGLLTKDAVRAILALPTYQAGALVDTASDALADRTTTRRLLTGAQYRRAVRERTGLVWDRSGADELDNDFTGFRVLVGGVDGEAVTEALRVPGTTYAAVTRRVAQAGARIWIDAHEDGTRPSAVFDVCAPDAAPSDACFREMLAALGWSLHAVRPDSARLDA
ncbi:MAG: hypothetical protein CL927_08130, partial [Deltaproteobacteria bacterium]|nr:hypothetical protein [Deltaproteobacteria bacterium]